MLLNCVLLLEQDGELWIDPVECKIWSPMFNDITWYEAVSSEEAQNGGCNQICDNDPDINVQRLIRELQTRYHPLMNWKIS